MCVCVCLWEGALVAPVFHLLLSSFPVPEDLEEGSFFPLCRYQEMIICCLLFHKDIQGWLPHAKFEEKIQQHLLLRPYIRCCLWLQLEFVFQNTIMTYKLSLKSRAAVMIVYGLALKCPGAEPAVSRPILSRSPLFYSNREAKLVNRPSNKEHKQHI